MEFSVENLKASPFFSNFDESDLLQIYSKLERQDLAEGEYLFKEGAPGDCLYILFKGKFIITVTAKMVEKTIGYVKRGEVVGELSIFSNAPRSASVKAAYSSIVMRLHREDFKAICFKNPKILWQVATVVATRSQSNIQLIRSDKKIQKQMIVILSMCQPNCSRQLVEEIRSQNLEKLNLQLIDYSASKQGANSLESENSTLYFIQQQDLVKNVEILHLADKVLIVIDEEQDFDSLKRSYEELGKIIGPIEKELVLLHNSYKIWYPNTEKYLKLSQFSRSHHIAFKTPVTIQRFLRFQSGNSIGLVLSGGGAKGWATVGVIKALYEHNIKADYVGGTSIGAIISAIYALTDNYDQFYQMFDSKLFSPKPFGFKKITWPIVSIFNGENETLGVKDICGDAKIEDLSLPFFSISSNVSTYGQTVWDKGYLWQACRASMSIPAILPPVTYLNQIHLDGGIINNFPVDVMSAKLDKHGYIIGVDISASSIDLEKYDFPAHIGFWEGLKMKMSGGKTKIINIAEIVNRLTMAGSIERTMQNDKLCDFLIKPNLDKFSFSDFGKKHEMIEVGYNEAIRELQKCDLLK